MRVWHTWRLTLVLASCEFVELLILDFSRYIDARRHTFFRSSILVSRSSRVSANVGTNGKTGRETVDGARDPA